MTVYERIQGFKTDTCTMSNIVSTQYKSAVFLSAGRHWLPSRHDNTNMAERTDHESLQ